MGRRVEARNATLAAIGLVLFACEAARAEERLPGNSVPLAESFGESSFLARCRAEEDPAVAPLAGGVQQVIQRFRVVELLRGSTHGTPVAPMTYACRLAERPVRRGETVLWIGRVARG